MINEVALIMLLGMFGWKIALSYIVSGLIIAIISGIIIGSLRIENLLEEFVLQNRIDASYFGSKLSWSERMTYAKSYTGDILKKVWPCWRAFRSLNRLLTPVDFSLRSGQDEG